MVNAFPNCNENWAKLIATGKVQVNLKRKHFKKNKTEEQSKIWFDDVDEILIEGSKTHSNNINDNKRTIKRPKNFNTGINTTRKHQTDPSDMLEQEGSEFELVSSKKIKKKKNVVNEITEDLLTDNHNMLQNNKLTKAIGLDCEMVGTGSGGSDNMLARVSIVNQYGQTLYDKYVQPRENVTDYRTAVSGITPDLIKNGENFCVVQKEVCDILKDRLLIGHAVHHDLKVLFLSHPRSDVRDTSKYKPFKQIFSGATPSLRKLTKHILKVDIQDGQHDSVEDARAAMNLYLLNRKKWEASLKRKH